MIEMDRDAIEIIGPERALLAPFLLIGSEHEVIDDQLGAPVEEIGEREGAPPPLELVRLFHALPRHRHAAARQRIALAREFLRGGEQVKARRCQSLWCRNEVSACRFPGRPNTRPSGETTGRWDVHRYG
jgi:hypothetical protein